MIPRIALAFDMFDSHIAQRLTEAIRSIVSSEHFQVGAFRELKITVKYRPSHLIGIRSMAVRDGS